MRDLSHSKQSETGSTEATQDSYEVAQFGASKAVVHLTLLTRIYRLFQPLIQTVILTSTMMMSTTTCLRQSGSMLATGESLKVRIFLVCGCTQACRSASPTLGWHHPDRKLNYPSSGTQCHSIPNLWLVAILCLTMEPVHHVTTSSKVLFKKVRSIVPPMLEKFHKGMIFPTGALAVTPSWAWSRATMLTPN